MKQHYLYVLAFGSSLCLQTIRADEKNTIINDTIKTYTINEVVVTSSTKETNDLRLLPGSISILSPQAISSRQIDALKDISGFVPNLYMPDYGSKLTSAIYIRGIGARSSGQSIGLYVDNVPYLDKSAFDFELNDIQRIEVLRGPQGTLYGRNAMGGIINIYTLSPFNYQGTKLSVSGGNYGAFKAKVSHYAKISDRIGISASGYYDRNDGFFINEYDHTRADAEQSAGGRFKLDWLITNGLKAQYTFNYDYVDQGAFPYGQYNKETGNVEPIRINDPSSYWRRTLNNSLYLEWKTDRIVLSSTTAYQYLKDDMKMDQDYTDKSIFILNQQQKQYAWSEEIAIKSNHARNYQWSFGGYGFYNSLNTDGPVTFKKDGIQDILQAAFNELKMPKITVKGDQDQIYFPGYFETPTYGLAAFHQSTYNNLFIPGLSLTAGIRLDYEKAKMKYDSSVEGMTMNIFMPSMGHGMPTINQDFLVNSRLVGKETQDFLQVLPKISLRYQCSPGTFTYVSVAKGYKTGGYNVQMFGDLVQAQAQYDLKEEIKQMMPPGMDFKNPPLSPVSDVASYKPEHSWNYEAGIRSELVKERLNAELTVFYMDIRDIQLTTFAENGSGRMITNGGKADSYGVELSLRAKIANGLTADVNYGFTHATFQDYLFKEKIGGKIVETDCKDHFIPYTPRHTVSVGLQYIRLFHHKWIDQFMVSAQYTGAGKIFWTEKNDISQSFYGVLNGKIGVRKGCVNLNIWSRNITDTDYQAFYFESFDNSFIQKGKPFQIGAEVAVAF